MAKFVLTAQLQLQGPSNVKQVVNNIQSQLKGVDVNVGVKGSPQAQKQLQKISKEANKAATAAGRMGKALGVSIRRFTGLAIATRAVSLFTNSLGAAVKEGIAFERELIKISQVTGKTIGQLKDLTNTITSLSTGLGVSSSSLLKTSRILSQAGFNARETEIALRTLAKTELAPTFEDITRTTEGAVAIFNQFGKGAAALEGQLGSLNAVAGKFAVEAGDLISVVRRTGGVFKAAGGDLNELIALFTSVRSTTRESAESIATGLRTIFTRIQRPKTIEFLKQYGVELETLEGKFVGPYEAVRRLSEATRGLEEGDLTFVKIAEEIAGFRQIGKVIPLLREFRVAQDALQVAQKGTNTLTDDAAKAQLALAVRINKVKEEFLALIRSITQTTTFQVMADVVLTLAENLIKLGEAIKPILPLLSALVAVRAIKGIGNFASGIGKGFSNARGFARGGVVPGTGNRDTVPAMLTPGEFVIRKRSVQKLGAGNLQSINRYADGGKVRGAIEVDGSKTGAFFLTPTEGVDRTTGFPGGQKGQVRIKNRAFLSQYGFMGKDEQSAEDYYFAQDANKRKRLLGATKTNALINAENKEALLREYNKRKNANAARVAAGQKPNQNDKRLIENFEQKFGSNGQLSNKDTINRIKEAQNVAPETLLQVTGSLGSFFPGKNDIENSAVAQTVAEATQNKLFEAVQTAGQKASNAVAGVSPIIDLNDSKLIEAATDLSKDENAARTTEGFVFEGIIQALTSAKLAGKGTTWDFGGSEGFSKEAQSGLAALFGDTFTSLLRADAKRSQSGSSIESIVKKIASDINSGNTVGYIGQKFASGGRVGTDTVPALLTPGEFVVNRASAKRIGYGSLNRMNKVGRYAKGGVVQRFQDGGGVGAFDASDAVSGNVIPNAGEIITSSFEGLKGIVGSLTERFRGLVSSTEKAEATLEAIEAPTFTKPSKGPAQMGKSTAGRDKKKLGFESKRWKKAEAEVAALSKSYNMAKKRSEELTGAEDKLTKEINQLDDSLEQLRNSAVDGAKGNKAVNRIVKKKIALETKRMAVGDEALKAEEGVVKLEKQRADSIAKAGEYKKGDQKGLRSNLKRGEQGTFKDSQVRQTKAFEEAQATKTAGAAPGGGEAATKKSIDLISRLGGAAFAAQTGLALIKPTVDENSSAFTKGFATVIEGTQGFLATISSTGLALAAFGIQLDLQAAKMAAQNVMGGLGDIGEFFKSTKGAKRVLSRTGGRLSSAGRALAGRGGMAGRLGGGALQKVGGVFTKIAKLGPGMARAATGLGLLAVGADLAGMGLKALYDNSQEINAAVEKGNVEEAGRLAEEKAGFERNVDVGSGMVSNTAGYAAAGAVIGTIIPGFGTAIGAAVGGVIGLGVGLLGLNKEIDKSIITRARADAAYVRAGKDIEAAAKSAKEAIEGFEKGTVDEGELFRGSAQAAATKQAKEGRADIAELSKKQERSGFAQFFGFDRYGKGESEAINKRVQQNVETSRQAFNTDADRRQAVFREQALQGLAGGTETDVTDTAFYQDTQAKAAETRRQAADAYERGDTVAGDALKKEADEYSKQLRDMAKEHENLKKSVARANEKFQALNLGLNQSAAAIGASNVAIQNLVASTDSSAPQLENSIRTLDASTTAAAGGIDAADFGKALDDASNTLLEYGADEGAVQKFRDNQSAIASAQKELPSVMARIKDDFEAGGLKGASAQAQQERFKEQLKVQLESQGMSEGAIDNIVKSLPNADELTDDQRARLDAGDFSVFEDQLNEIGQKQLAEVKKQLEEAAAVERQMIELTKKRIAAENNLIAAQQQAIDMQMEARGFEEEFGGKRVTLDERRQAAAARTNVLGRSAGLSDVDGTDVASLRRRRQEITAGFSATQLAPGQKQTPENEAQQERLKQAQAEQAKTIRELIQIQKDEIKQIQEKQRLEKEALDSLLAGDIDKFFEQQAAQGAIAASATGNQSLMNAFGADATGMAAKELQRLQAAGVNEMYGVQIGGAGGLAETTALAGFQQRGLDGQAAVRAAQIQAGTTDEQLAAEARGRELAAELGATGEMGVDMAADELQTAAQMLQEAARLQQQAKDEAQMSEDRGELTGAGVKQDRVVADKKNQVVQAESDLAAAAKREAEAREAANKAVEDATRQQRESGEVDESTQQRLTSSLDELGAAGRAKEHAGRVLANRQAELKMEQEKRQQIQSKYDETGTRIGAPEEMIQPEGAPQSTLGGFFDAIGFGRPAIAPIPDIRAGAGAAPPADAIAPGAPAGTTAAVPTLDASSTASLDNFSNSVASLQGMEVAHTVGGVNVNLGGAEFLANLQPEIKNTVIDEIQAQLENYRPTTAGMKPNKGVLPTA